MKIETKADVGQRVFFMNENICEAEVVGVRVTKGMWATEACEMMGTTGGKDSPPLIEYLLKIPRGIRIGEYFNEDDIGTTVDELLAMTKDRYLESHQKSE